MKNTRRAPGGRKRRTFGILLLCIVTAAVTAAAYLPVTGYGFLHYDDALYLTENPHLADGLTADGLAWAFTSVSYGANWHPLTWLSHMADVQLFGMKAGPHHAVNVLFHLLNTVLLFLVLHSMTGTLWRSALVSVLFSLHPLHVESVAWIAERKDVLSTFLGLLALGAYVRYARIRGRRPYLLTCALLLLGLMAKPMLVTLPVIFLLLDWWPLGRTKGMGALPMTHLLAEKIPLLLIAFLSGAVTYAVQRQSGALDFSQYYPLGLRIGNALVSYVGYLAKTLWPHGLAVFYPFPEGGLPAWKIALAGLAMAGATAAALRAGKGAPYLTVGWLWYLITLLPVIGIVQLGVQAMADRYTYLSLIGIFTAASWSARALAPRRPLWRAAAALVLLAALFLSTRAQVRYWKDGVTLFAHALEVAPSHWMSRFNLGVALHEAGRLGEARVQYEESVALNPNFRDAQYNLGVILLRRKEWVEAAGAFREALRVSPKFPDAHFSLGNALLNMDRPEEALAAYSRAVSFDPGHAGALYAMGWIYEKEGRTEEALRYYRRALQSDAGHEGARRAVGRLSRERDSLRK